MDLMKRNALKSDYEPIGATAIMNIALNTDFAAGTGNPEPWLRGMAKAGFTHVHWCHQWNTDFMYVDAEIKQIKEWLVVNGLTLLDIHGSVGPEKNWFSEMEYQRKAGVELVANRLKMHHALGGTGAVMMHLPHVRSDHSEETVKHVWKQVGQLEKSLDELMPLVKELNVPLALENFCCDTFDVLRYLFDKYPADCVGLCFDSGHGNMGDCRGLDNLDTVKDRLMALHIHDNDCNGDQHQPPFYGKLDWERFARILASSPYPREISFELARRNTPYSEDKDIDLFLADAYERCARFVNMVRP